MGIRRLAIEAKTFDIVVEKALDSFFYSITKAGRGFLFSILLGWESAKWLCDLMFALRVGKWKDVSERRCRDKSKLFLADIGKNFRGDFLVISKFFQGGRRISLMIPKGWEGKDWYYFGKALEELLSSVTAHHGKVNHNAGPEATWFQEEGRRSFADVVKRKVPGSQEVFGHGHGRPAVIREDASLPQAHLQNSLKFLCQLSVSTLEQLMGQKLIELFYLTISMLY